MLVAVASLKGSPGVTTLSLALAACWPPPLPAILLEADPAGGDLAVRMGLPPTPGTVSLAAATRRGGAPELLWQHAQRLPCGLPVIPASPNGHQASGVLTALTQEAGLTALQPTNLSADAVVVADCGRLDGKSPALAVVHIADVLLLVTRARAEDVAHVATQLATIGHWTRHPALVLVGDGHSRAEVTQAVGVTPLAHVPDDARGVVQLSGRIRGGGPGPRRRSGLERVAADIAALLAPAQRSVPGGTTVRTSTPQAPPSRAGSPSRVPGADLVPRGATTTRGQDR